VSPVARQGDCAIVLRVLSDISVGLNLRKYGGVCVDVYGHLIKYRQNVDCQNERDVRVHIGGAGLTTGDSG